jgi:hypothetical protein
MIFGSNTVTGSLKKLHNEERHDFYSSRTIVGVIQPRTGFRGYWWGDLKKKSSIERRFVDGMMMMIVTIITIKSEARASNFCDCQH